MDAGCGVIPPVDWWRRGGDGLAQAMQIKNSAPTIWKFFWQMNLQVCSYHPFSQYTVHVTRIAYGLKPVN